MSGVRRLWLMIGAACVVAVVGFLVLQAAFQEVETQEEEVQEPPGNTTGEAPPGQAGNAAEVDPTYQQGARRQVASDRIIVKIEEDATRRDLEEINDQTGARTERDLPRSDVNVIGLPRDLPVNEAIERYEDSPDVEYAEPDFLLQPAQTEPTPSDPDYPRLYGLNNTGQTGGVADADVDAPEAWNTTVGDPGIVVAVIDEGVDIDHPDLKGNVWVNPDEVPGNGMDDDRNGYVDDVNGFDFANDDASVYDPDPVTGTGDEHGTHVAGTIAAVGGNGVGVTGVSWRAGIMPLKFLGPKGGYTSDAVEAINYAVAEGVKISNNSWGGGGDSQSLRDAIARADASGHLLVAAAGNGGADGVGDDNDATPNYPSSYDLPNVLSVAATDSKDALASFSNFGSASVDVAAPGVGILSTLPKNTYGSYSGTSMATPHVAGIAALLESRDPSLDDARIKAQILDSVDVKSGLSGKVSTGGRVNAARALGTEPPPPDTTDPDTSISSGPSGTTRATSAGFGFVASEAVARFECSLDGAAFAACSSPKGYPGLASRAHTFRVRAVDRAGNVDATPASRTWTVDAIPPTVFSPSPASGSSTRDRTPLVKAVARDSQTNLGRSNVRLYVDGKRITRFSYGSSTDRLGYTTGTLAHGRHTVKVVAADAAGNVGSRSWRFSVVR